MRRQQPSIEIIEVYKKMVENKKDLKITNPETKGC
jgi:hypothetical protein